MLSVHLICVGKLKEKFYLEAAAEYQKRLSAYCKLTLVELPEEKLPQNPTQGQIDQALFKEAQAIRAMDRSDAATVPIIAVTANAFAEDIAKTTEAGMDAHISKPIDFVVLNRTLARLINGEKRSQMPGKA